MKIYSDLAYAKERLVGTIALVDNKAAYIENLSEKKVTYLDYISGKREVVDIKLLDPTPVRLGYCNFEFSMSYLCRYPVRKDWKQGLNYNTLRVIGSEYVGEMIPYSEIFKTINGEYPKILDAIKQAQAVKHGGVAYSRDFAISHKMEIWYKGQFAMGKVTEFGVTEDFIEIYEQYEFLRDALEASVA